MSDEEDEEASEEGNADGKEPHPDEDQELGWPHTPEVATGEWYRMWYKSGGVEDATSDDSRTQYFALVR